MSELTPVATPSDVNFYIENNVEAEGPCVDCPKNCNWNAWQGSYSSEADLEAILDSDSTLMGWLSQDGKFIHVFVKGYLKYC